MLKAPHLYHLWAKSDPFHPLPCHLIDVGQTALALLETPTFRHLLERLSAASNLTLEELRPWIGLLCALHDLGKCADPFQAQQPNLLPPLRAAGLPAEPQQAHFRHERLSAAWVNEWLKNRQWPRQEAQTMAGVVRLHHSRAITPGPLDESGPWAEARDSLATAVEAIFLPPPVQPHFADHSTVGLILSGLLVLADWIASNPELFHYEWTGEELPAYAATSMAKARSAVAALGFDQALPWATGQRFQDLWPKIKRPRPLQVACESLCQGGAKPGLLLIEAPMGEGKTEAGLYVASQWGRGGLYVALPTAATSNQMYGRVRELAETHRERLGDQVRLVHGQAWLHDAPTPSAAPLLDDEGLAEADLTLDWFRPKRRALLALLGVGTIDQALMAAMHVRFGFLRLLGLAGKALVIDECHAYDAYMSTILERLLAWCGHLGVPVVLLSATLPAARRRALLMAYRPTAALDDLDGAMGYPLLTHLPLEGAVRPLPVSGAERTQTLHLERHWGLLGDVEGVARLAWAKASQDGCMAVILNTVVEAQAVFAALMAEREHHPETELFLFHSRFVVADRMRIEAEILARFGKEAPNRPKRAILVATQVVEQSLDIDFDVMISAIAPIDLVLQRSGRLHRHDRDRRPTGRQAVLHLLLPPQGKVQFDPSERIYSRYLLLRTVSLLCDRSVLTLPGEIRSLIEAVYDTAGHPALDADWPAAEVRAARDREAAERAHEAKAAEQFLLPIPKAQQFGLALQGAAYEEGEEGAAQAFVAARTRLGDQTMSLLLLTDERWDPVLRQARPPIAEHLAAIHLQTVKVPAWWARSVSPAEGHTAFFEAPRWLPGITVVRLVDFEWQGWTEKGQVRRLQHDPVLGLRCLMEEVEESEPL